MHTFVETMCNGNFLSKSPEGALLYFDELVRVLRIGTLTLMSLRVSRLIGGACIKLPRVMIWN